MIIQRIKIVIAFVALFYILISCEQAESASQTGKGGSMARFTIAGNNLYAVDDQDMHVFSLQNPREPIEVTEKHIGSGIETIFPFSSNLFVGSESGMYVYDITDGNNPKYVSDFVHIQSCDPVVSDGKYAYVTLRSGSDCRIGLMSNQLDVIDISDIRNPELVRSYPVPEPYGLAVDDTLLFICHGSYGLGVYNISEVDNISEIVFIENVETYDVIPENKILVVIGPSGLMQYNYSDINNIYLLSSITTNIALSKL